MARQRRDREELHRLRKLVAGLDLTDRCDGLRCSCCSQLQTIQEALGTSAPESPPGTTAPAAPTDGPALPDGFSAEEPGATSTAPRPTGSTTSRHPSRTRRSTS